MTTTMTQADLLVLIEESFQVAKPKHFLHPDCFDDMDIAAYYPFERWQDIPDALIDYEYAGLFPASSEAFQFLIPAFMRFSVLYKDLGKGSIDSTFLALRPDQTLFDFQVSKYERLSPAQKTTILAFLEFMQPYHEDAKAAKDGMEILWSEDF